MGKLLPAIAGALVVGAVSLLGSQKKNVAPARNKPAKKTAPRRHSRSIGSKRKAAKK